MNEYHEHSVVTPLSRKQADAKLRKLTLVQLRDIAAADVLPLNNNFDTQIEIILTHWFPPHSTDGPISMPEMLELAEKMPPGKRPVWRKRTHGKEMGF